MDFFEHQDRAHRNTWKLVVLFIIGIFATLAAINLLCFLGYWFFLEPETITHQVQSSQIPSLFKSFLTGEDFSIVEHRSGIAYAWQSWWHSNLNWQINVGVTAAVVIGTLFRFLELSGGGKKVAQWAGARLVDVGTRQPEYRQFINVSEEMAIAAGMAVPELYVMEREQGINAFVAGLTPDDSVLVVTRGALQQLSRDELQGVIGHEYSHILNGDMRLNVRLMAFLAGLVMIGQIGRFMLHNSFYSGGYRSSSSRFSLLSGLFGFVFAGVGYIGVLVGRMIKAAVSRQREYLADASSVQFTRNPDGLSGALYKIHSNAEGSMLSHRHAEDMSHFCFGESVALSDKLATHPPILSRIKRINPNYIHRARARARQEAKTTQTSAAQPMPAFELGMTAVALSSLAGTVTPDHLDYARRLYKHIPPQLKDWVHQSAGAKAYLYGQAILGSREQKQAMLKLLKEEDSVAVTLLQDMWQTLQQMDEQLRLPVLELSMPTIRRLPELDRLVFLDRMERLIKLDGRIDFIEWVTFTLLKRRIGDDEKKNTRLASNIAPFRPAIEEVLSAFRSLSPSPDQADRAYRSLCRSMSLSPKPERHTNEFTPLADALIQLSSVSFTWRKVILEGCADIVQSNGRVAFKEYEALRVVADCMECPLPILRVEPGTTDPRDEPIPFY
jgi:Zn-dependent protease with chaperone function